MKIMKEQRMDFLTYPLSGGYHHLSFCPVPLYGMLQRLERLLFPMNSYLAFRIFIVLEKVPH
jgi:hypothetical protein